MTNLSQVVNVQTMSSLEIAELTGKQHKNVLADIRKMLTELEEEPAEILAGDKNQQFKFQSAYLDAKGEPRVCFQLPKRECLILVSGYNVKMRAAIIDRWQELETKQEQPRPQLEYTPAQRAEVDFKAIMGIAKIANVPDHYALQEAAKIASRASGCDITRLVTQGKDMNNVPDKDVMLEPTELGKHFGLSGKAMNEKLKDLDLQYKHRDSWLPTEKGNPLCERHAWAVKNKSGYNLKWRLSDIVELMKG